MIDIIASLAAFMVVFIDIPQILKTYKLKDVSGLSFIFILMRWIMICLWMTYGHLINNSYIFISNLISLGWISILLTLFLFYNKKTNKRFKL